MPSQKLRPVQKSAPGLYFKYGVKYSLNQKVGGEIPIGPKPYLDHWDKTSHDAQPHCRLSRVAAHISILIYRFEYNSENYSKLSWPSG